MARGKSLCLNMIVKNEMANLPRCFGSVADHIASWVIGDTGSTDGTQDFIRDFFQKRGIPGELYSSSFENFEQARNQALEHAYASPLEFDYLLFADADMELIVDDPDFRSELVAPGYMLLQRAGIAYWNTRLVRRDVRATYHGVTHEYIDVPGGTERLQDVWYRDHASGSNRVAKFERDIGFLLEGLKSEPENHRYWFYLAQSYRDAGRLREAVDAYAKRAEMGGWDEEAWYARLQEARCLRDLGDEGEFLRAALRAYGQRPRRAEPLHDLARYYRERSMNAENLLFSEPGCKLVAPEGDALFIESWVYDYGLLDEFAVGAYWVGRYQECRDVCDRLLTEGKIPEDMRARVEENANFAREKLEALANGPSQLACAEIHLSRGLTTSLGFSASGWHPEAPAAGTELMLAGLKERLGPEVERIDLMINRPGTGIDSEERPRVVWIHHDYNQEYMQWCNDASLVNTVTRFVFVSDWQRQRYLRHFELPAERCVVLRNATEVSSDWREWKPGPIWRCAYTSTAFRGLAVLLDAWENLAPRNAELNIWSSMRLYHQDDSSYRGLYERAQSLRSVKYHGIVPNADLRVSLRDMHFLVYPSTFAETSCLAVIEAMAAGCRVIVPSLGALPETTGGYALVYPWVEDGNEHASNFSKLIANEFEQPWEGKAELSLAQQYHCKEFFDWPHRAHQWRDLLQSLSNR